MRVRLFQFTVISLICFAAIMLMLYYPTGSMNASNFLEANIVATPLADTYVASGIEDQRRPILANIWVGHDDDERKIRRSLLKFDTNSIEQKSTIDSAILYLYMAGTTPNDGPLDATIYRMLDDFNEDINWTEHLSKRIDPTKFVTTSITTESRWYEWEVKELLQAWLDDPDPNRPDSFGLQMRGPESGQHRRSFWSKECTECDARFPRLEISYRTATPIPPTATPVPPTNTPTPTFTPGVQLQLSQTIASPTPDSSTLSAAPSDTANPGDVISYTVRYQYVNGKTPITGLVISNTIPNNTEFIQADDRGKREGEQVIWNVGKVEPTGNESSGTVSYQVRYTNPLVDFEVITIPTSQTIGADITFLISPSLDIDVDSMIDFGDMTEKGSLPANHCYNDPDDYTVTITIATSSCITVKTLLVEISDNKEPDKCNNIPVEPPELDSTLPSCSNDTTIYNAGAIATWDGHPTPVSSSGLFINPPVQIYMPIIGGEHPLDR